MNTVQIICQKRDGRELSRVQLAHLIDGFLDGSVADYQMSAFAMAVLLRGMTDDETCALSELMMRSGSVMDWKGSDRPVVDKHSSGGVGDKTSIVLAPALASCGVLVPMISGRGLGATGGTLDKLESIPGFNCQLTIEQIQSITEQVGCVITGATSQIAPADQKLYALRDVTGTVPSVPLITASILSKKLAEGLSTLVLDIKFGSGSFMKSLTEARNLARSLVRVAHRMSVNTIALITDMNQPLGQMIGNSLEIDESLAVLGGEGPSDVRELVVELGAQVLVASCGQEPASARANIEQAIDSGAATAKLQDMIAAQGGDLAACRQRATSREVPAPRAGWIQSIDTEALGWAVIDLGGGRRKLDDVIDPRAGLQSLARIGDRVESGQPLARIFCDRPGEETCKQVAGAYEIRDRPAAPGRLIVERVLETG